MEKICTKCGEEYPATTEYWYKQKNGKYGLRSICKKCSYNAHKKYMSNPKAKEKHRLEMAKWRKENPEEARAVSRKSHQKHKDKRNAERRDKYHNDSEYRRKKDERDKNYRASVKGQKMLNKPENREKAIIRSKKYRKLNPEKIKAYWKKYRSENTEFLNQLDRKYREKLTDAYVRKQIKRNLHTDIEVPASMIETRRLTIQIKRALNKRKNG